MSIVMTLSLILAAITGLRAFAMLDGGDLTGMGIATITYTFIAVIFFCFAGAGYQSTWIYYGREIIQTVLALGYSLLMYEMVEEARGGGIF